MEYDVVVVGAGPAGSTAAKVLAEKGKNVLLVEKTSFPRDKACGGGLPTRVLKHFPYIIDFLNSISYGSITYSSSLRYKLSIIRDQPLLCFVCREDFDNGLAALAKKKGAMLKMNMAVHDIKIENTHATVFFENGETVRTQMIIGCDGVRSLVAEKIRQDPPHHEKCLCLVQEYPMSTQDLDRYYTTKRVSYIFIKTHGIAGYGWIFPKKHFVNVGIGEFESAVDKNKPRVPLKDFYNQFIGGLQQLNLLPADFDSSLNLKGGVLPIFPLEKTYFNRVLLCGDAAGFINPITGEGIYYAMRSGELAAQIAVTALNTHDTSETKLAQYQKNWMNDFGKDLLLFGRFNYQWGKNSDKFVRLLTRDRMLAKLVVGVTGGQIKFSKYKYLLFLRYLYASAKDILQKK